MPYIRLLPHTRHPSVERAVRSLRPRCVRRTRVWLPDVPDERMDGVIITKTSPGPLDTSTEPVRVVVSHSSLRRNSFGIFQHLVMCEGPQEPWCIMFVAEWLARIISFALLEMWPRNNHRLPARDQYKILKSNRSLRRWSQPKICSFPGNMLLTTTKTRRVFSGQKQVRLNPSQGKKGRRRQMLASDRWRSQYGNCQDSG